MESRHEDGGTDAMVATMERSAAFVVAYSTEEECLTTGRLVGKTGPVGLLKNGYFSFPRKRESRDTRVKLGFALSRE